MYVHVDGQDTLRVCTCGCAGHIACMYMWMGRTHCMYVHVDVQDTYRAEGVEMWMFSS